MRIKVHNSLSKTSDDRFILNNIYLETTSKSRDIFIMDKKVVFSLFMFKSKTKELIPLWEERHYREAKWSWTKINWKFLLNFDWKELSD